MWVGAVASLDTSNCLATFVVQQRIIVPELQPNTLTIVSVDNIDILQTHAMVSACWGLLIKWLSKLLLFLIIQPKRRAKPKKLTNCLSHHLARIVHMVKCHESRVHTSICANRRLQLSGASVSGMEVHDTPPPLGRVEPGGSLQSQACLDRPSALLLLLPFLYSTE